MAEEQSILNVPEVEPVVFSRNFVKSVVCELRFPVLLEIESKALAAFQKAIRGDYPNYDRQESVDLGPGSVQGRTAHVFRSRDHAWLLVVKNSMISVETTKYTQFEQILERLDAAMPSILKFIDAAFFTRVGLRYVNAVPVSEGFEGWINSDLVKPLSERVYGQVFKFVQEIRGKAATGGYTFRHGFSPEEGSKNDPRYVLDFDFYAENVEVEALRDLVPRLNLQSYNFFIWALGPKAIEYLGQSKKKTEQKRVTS